MKFQRATSPGGQPQLAVWLGVAALVLLAGEAAYQATWYWLGLVTLLAAILGVAAWLQQGPGARALVAGLGLLGVLAAIAAIRGAHLVLHAGALPGEAVSAARQQRTSVLRRTLAGAHNAAVLALERTGDSPADRAPSLDDLISNSDIESAIVVIAGDTVIAVAGPHRMQSIYRPGPAALVSTPFARLLVIRQTRGHRQAQVVLLLDSIGNLPTAGPSLASSAGGWQGVAWHWTAAAPLDRPVEYASVDSAVAGVNAAMQPVPPPLAVFVSREARVARLLVGAGVLALCVIILLSAPEPAARVGAVLLPLWALVRSDVGSTAFGLSAIRAALAAAALLLLAIALWRRPVRRSVVGLFASVLLLGTAPPLVVLVARALLPHNETFTLVTGFGWEVIFALAAGGLLTVAAAPLRAPDDANAGPVWGILATAAALLVGLIGVEAWTPTGCHQASSCWASWYPLLWLLPIGLLLPVTAPRARLLALATTAGVLAALATWSTSLDRRMEMAEKDVARLNATADTASAHALDQLAVAARAAHATRLDRLYAAWGASRLARLGVPTYLALWNRDGRQREVIALDSISVGWGELAPIVRFGGDSAERFSMARGVGHHEVLVLPLAPDTVATVTIGPRSRLLSPTTFGLLVGWRSTRDAPYSVDVVAGLSAPADTEFHRSHRYVTTERLATAGDQPRTVRAIVAISPWQPFVVRSALIVLVDVAAIFAAWLILQRILGLPGTLPGPVFRRSYRRTVATALTAFFVVPATLFTLSSVARLRRSASQQLAGDLATTLRDAAEGGGLKEAAAVRPRSDSLSYIGDDVDAEIAIYRQGRLVAAGDSMLAELGLLPPMLGHLGPAPLDGPKALAPPLRGSGLRLGVIQTSQPTTLLAAEIPGSDTGLAGEQFDQVLRLLLAALAGTGASILVAGIIARALGRPIETLRRTALAIGRREDPPVATDVPAEFVPVFGAIRQMEHDLRTTEAELHAGRARTAAILSTVATGVIGIDADGSVIHANPRAMALLGRSIALGGALRDQLPAGWNRVSDGIARLLGRASAPESHELEVGEERFAITLAPLADGGLVLAITDITEASRAARVLAWGEMARQVAHEIKNPLTPMRLGLQHLRRLRHDDSVDYPGLVGETAERLLSEIERLDKIARSFARYGAPPERAQPVEPIALRPAAEELASLFALSTDRPRIQVIGDATGPVCARREELVQVLLNLLENARQAGASVVRLAIDGYTLRIEDDGKGIAADQLAHIFEPSFSTKTSGTGLGLAIVRRLVEGWEATIAVESEPGGGAVFVIHFVPGKQETG